MLQCPAVAPQKSVEKAGETRQEGSRLYGEVELISATFGYSPLGRPFFKEIDLQVAPGNVIALVGGSGSGKSTLARLVCGDYPLWDGEVRFDGILRDDIPEKVLANSFSVVDQEISLFAATVRDNLTMWDQTVPNDRLIAACDDAAIRDVIESLPNGFETEILEGGAISVAGSASGWRLHARWFTSPQSLFWTKPPARWTLKPRQWLWSVCGCAGVLQLLWLTG